MTRTTEPNTFRSKSSHTIRASQYWIPEAILIFLYDSAQSSIPTCCREICSRGLASVSSARALPPLPAAAFSIKSW